MSAPTPGIPFILKGSGKVFGGILGAARFAGGQTDIIFGTACGMSAEQGQ
jgi:hypothetical protein